MNTLKTTTQIHQAEAENYERLTQSAAKNRKFYINNNME